MILADHTARAPAAYRKRTRALEEVDLVVLHQTGTPAGLDAAVLDRVKAHALILDSGEVLQLHPWAARLRYGSGPWNARCVTIEHRANLPGRYHRGAPRWASGKAPREVWDADARRLQVLASRDLLARLRRELPALRFVAAHRMIDCPRKGGCPGPDLWREVGEWALDALGLELAEVEPTGAALPPDWRRPPTITPGAPGGTVGGRPPARPYPPADGPEPSPFAS